MALGVLTLASLGLVILPFVGGLEARLAQATLIGLFPAAILGLAASASRRPRLALVTAILLGSALSGSLLALVVLQTSSQVGTASQVAAGGSAGTALAVMLGGLVLVPLVLMTWSYAASIRGSTDREDPS